jgi:hypothetical protein
MLAVRTTKYSQTKALVRASKGRRSLLMSAIEPRESGPKPCDSTLAFHTKNMVRPLARWS